MLQASLKKNDKSAAWLIGIFSFVVFAVVVSLGRIQLNVNVGFDVHLFATFNAFVNGVIAMLLLAAFWAVRHKLFVLHRNLMIGALLLSIIFLLSYIAHHLLSGDTKYGGEGILRYVYYFILITHVVLAAVILPFILFTAYRGLTAEFGRHRRLAKITWPLWLYVAITGPVVYWFIHPYYT